MGENVANGGFGEWYESCRPQCGMWWSRRSPVAHEFLHLGYSRAAQLAAIATTSPNANVWAASMTTAEDAWFTAQPAAAQTQIWLAACFTAGQPRQITPPGAPQ